MDCIKVLFLLIQGLRCTVIFQCFSHILPENTTASNLSRRTALAKCSPEFNPADVCSFKYAKVANLVLK